MTPWLLLCSLRSGFHQNLSPCEVYFKRATKNPCTCSRRWLGQNDIRIQASERNFFIIWSVLHERWRCSFLPRKSWALQCPVQLYVIMFSAALHHRITTSHSRHIQKLLQPHLSSQRTFAKISQSTTILNGRNHCCGALERVACWERRRSDSAHWESLLIMEKSLIWMPV